MKASLWKRARERRDSDGPMETLKWKKVFGEKGGRNEGSNHFWGTVDWGSLSQFRLWLEFILFFLDVTLTWK